MIILSMYFGAHRMLGTLWWCYFTSYSQFHKTLPRSSLQMHWIIQGTLSGTFGQGKKQRIWYFIDKKDC